MYPRLAASTLAPPAGRTYLLLDPRSNFIEESGFLSPGIVDRKGLEAELAAVRPGSLRDLSCVAEGTVNLARLARRHAHLVNRSAEMRAFN